MITRTPKPKGRNIALESAPHTFKSLRPENSRAGGVKARSVPESQRMSVYNAILAVWNPLHPYCEACELIAKFDLRSDALMGLKSHPQTTNHHRRGRDGILLFDVREFIPCCLWAHQWIENNKESARKLGLESVLYQACMVFIVSNAMWVTGMLSRKEFPNHPSGEKCHVYSLRPEAMALLAEWNKKI